MNHRPAAATPAASGARQRKLQVRAEVSASLETGGALVIVAATAAWQRAHDDTWSSACCSAFAVKPPSTQAASVSASRHGPIPPGAGELGLALRSRRSID